MSTQVGVVDPILNYIFIHNKEAVAFTILKS